MTDFSEQQRQHLAEDNKAMPDGSYPIRNVRDLKHAIQSYGRAKDPEAMKRWIIKRSRQLNAVDMLPDEWRSEFAHYGVKGMKWGVRKKRQSSGRSRYSNESKDYSRSAELSKKKIHEMTNEELNFMNYRYNLERQYKQFNPKRESAGKRFVNSKAGKMAIGTLSSVAIAAGVAVVGNKVGMDTVKGLAGFVPGGRQVFNAAQQNAEFLRKTGSKIKANHQAFNAAKNAAKAARQTASRRMI